MVRAEVRSVCNPALPGRGSVCVGTRDQCRGAGESGGRKDVTRAASRNCYRFWAGLEALSPPRKRAENLSEKFLGYF